MNGVARVIISAYEAPGRGAERQSPMGVAIREPQPPLSRRGSDHRPRNSGRRDPSPYVNEPLSEQAENA